MHDDGGFLHPDARGHEHAAHGGEPDDFGAERERRRSKRRTTAFYPPNQWPTPAAGIPPLLTTRDVLRYATMNGAKALRLDSKVGSLTPGKEADIIILDATAINVAPLNQVPGAVVSLMDRTNVETVIVAGKVRKWKGQLLDVDLDQLRSQLEASRDYHFPGGWYSAELVQQPVRAQTESRERGRHQVAPFLICGDSLPRSATFAAFLKTDL